MLKNQSTGIDRDSISQNHGKHVNEIERLMVRIALCASILKMKCWWKAIDGLLTWNQDWRPHEYWPQMWTNRRHKRWVGLVLELGNRQASPMFDWSIATATSNTHWSEGINGKTKMYEKLFGMANSKIKKNDKNKLTLCMWQDSIVGNAIASSHFQ